MTTSYTVEAAKTLFRMLAKCCMAAIILMIVHKGYVDISMLAEKHSDGEFWLELAKYFLRNLSGGGPPSS